MQRCAVILSLALLAGPLAAQEALPPVGAVAPFAWMIGEWEGPATMDMGPRGGGRHELRQHEWVRTVASGTALSVTGQGIERRADGRDTLAFDAFAVIYPSREGGPGLRTFRHGQYLDPTITLTPTGFIWSFTDPRAGTIRYTVTHTPDDEWHEIGEREVQPGRWVQFLEMRLRRLTPAGGG